MTAGGGGRGGGRRKGKREKRGGKERYVAGWSTIVTQHTIRDAGDNLMVLQVNANILSGRYCGGGREKERREKEKSVTWLDGLE